MTHQQMRIAVEKELKRSVRDDIWEWLEKEEYVSQAIDDEEEVKGQGVKWLAEKVQGLEALSRPSKEEEIKSRAVSCITKEVSPDKRFWALSQVVASLASRNEEVQKFRSEVLGGRLLAPGEVPKWIEEVANSEGIEEDRDVLEYISPISPWVYSVGINKNGILGRLKRIARRFKDIWREAQAVYFILTGQIPAIPMARITQTIGPFPRITLEVSPHLTTEQVAKIYAKAKREYEQRFGQRRKLSEKHLTLAVFGVEEEGSWEQLRIKWNRQHPHEKWAFKDRANFARAVKDAYERLTGWEWKTAPFNEKMDRASFEDLLREFNAK